LGVARIKIFRRGDPVKLEGEVNEWLSALSPQVAIERSETVMTMKDNVPLIVISVWYVESSN